MQDHNTHTTATQRISGTGSPAHAAAVITDTTTARQWAPTSPSAGLGSYDDDSIETFIESLAALPTEMEPAWLLEERTRHGRGWRPARDPASLARSFAGMSDYGA